MGIASLAHMKNEPINLDKEFVSVEDVITRLEEMIPKCKKLEQLDMLNVLIDELSRNDKNGN